MRYEIITNPVSGNMTIDEKRSALTDAAEILDAQIHGLDTTSSGDFCRCAREIAPHCDILVVAGGDGAFSDIINSIDTSSKPVAFLPLGTGNAMRHALQYKGGMHGSAIRIRDGEIHEYDLIGCKKNKRAFMVSIGIEGEVIRLRHQYREQGHIGFNTYFKAVMNAYFRKYKRTTIEISLDDRMVEVKNLLSLMIVKQPFYGFKMKVVPKARFDDRYLHIQCINSGLFMTIFGCMSAFTIGNRIGRYITARKLSVKAARPLVMQIDGNEGWEADAFSFNILHKALKIKC